MYYRWHTLFLVKKRHKMIHNLGIFPGAFQIPIMILFMKYVIYKNYPKANHSNCMLFTFDVFIKAWTLSWNIDIITSNLKINLIEHLSTTFFFTRALKFNEVNNVRYRISKNVYAVTFITKIFDHFLLFFVNTWLWTIIFP